jgi:hypothetical protein
MEGSGWALTLLEDDELELLLELELLEELELELDELLPEQDPVDRSLPTNTMVSTLDKPLSVFASSRIMLLPLFKFTVVLTEVQLLQAPVEPKSTEPTEAPFTITFALRLSLEPFA